MKTEKNNSPDHNIAFLCDECGSADVFANESGEYVCHDCGLCFDDPVLNITQEDLLTDRHGEILHHHSIRLGTGTLIGLKKEQTSRAIRRLSRWQSICNMTPSDEARIYVRQLCAEFDITLGPHKIMGLFKKIYPLLPPRTKSRNILYLSTISTIITLRNYGIEYHLKRILRWANLKLPEYFAIMTQIHKVAPHYDRINEADLESNTCKLLHNMQVKFHLSFAIYQLARKLVQQYRVHLGEKVRIIASSALSVALEVLKRNQQSDLQGINLSAFQISKYAHVSASTVYARKKAFPYESIDMEKLLRAKEMNPQRSHTVSCAIPLIPVPSIHQNTKRLTPQTPLVAEVFHSTILSPHHAFSQPIQPLSNPNHSLSSFHLSDAVALYGGYPPVSSRTLLKGSSSQKRVFQVTPRYSSEGKKDQLWRPSCKVNDPLLPLTIPVFGDQGCSNPSHPTVWFCIEASSRFASGASSPDPFPPPGDFQ